MPGTRLRKRHRKNVRLYGWAATGIEHGGWYCPKAVVGYSGLFPLLFFPSLQNAILMPSRVVLNTPCCSALVVGWRETTWIGPDGHRNRVPAGLFFLFGGWSGGPDPDFSPFPSLFRVGLSMRSRRGLALGSGSSIAGMCACAGGRPPKSSMVAVKSSFCR